MTSVAGNGRAAWRAVACALLAVGLLSSLFTGRQTHRRPSGARVDLPARHGGPGGQGRLQPDLLTAAPLARLLQESLDRALDTKALPEDDDDAVLAAADQLDRDAVQDMLDQGASCLARLTEETGDLQHLPLQLPPPPPTSEPGVESCIASQEGAFAPTALPGHPGGDRPHSRPAYGSGYASPRAPPARPVPVAGGAV